MLEMRIVLVRSRGYQCQVSKKSAQTERRFFLRLQGSSEVLFYFLTKKKKKDCKE